MFSLIVAMNVERVIGIDNSIPWHYSADLRRFKKLTKGSTIVMGRRTWESIGGSPLPKRRNVVISSTLKEIEGAEVFPSISDFLENDPESPVWFIGGRGIYQEALGRVSTMDITLVPDVVKGENLVKFPPFSFDEWVPTSVSRNAKDASLLHFKLERR